MPAMELILKHVLPFCLVAVRLLGLFVGAPLLSGVSVPMQIKALLAIALSICVYPSLPSSIQVEPDLNLVGLVGLVAGETLIGFSMGLIAGVPLLFLESAGVIAGQEMGLGIGRVYNPDSDTEVDILGQLLTYLGTGAFLAVGGLDVLFVAISRTFGRIPAGGLKLTQAPLEGLIGVVTSGTELALRVAAPVTGVIVLLVIIFGVIGKTMPQINIMNVGFTVKVFAGVAMLALAPASIAAVAGDEISAALRHVINWTDGLGR